MIDVIYKNHPGLDVRYYEVFKEFPDLASHIEQLEVCDRKGDLTLAIWLNQTEFTLYTVVPFMLKLFDDILTEAQISKYQSLVSENSGSTLLIVNPDKYKQILRYYYRHDYGIFGADITREGDISKTKVYTGSTSGVLTTHTYPNGDVKKTYAVQTTDVVGYPSCEVTITREDRHIYYLYLPLITYKD
jgi:hypothetical protein